MAFTYNTRPLNPKPKYTTHRQTSSSRALGIPILHGQKHFVHLRRNASCLVSRFLNVR